MGRHHGARERRGKVEPGVKVTLARRACVRGSECTVGSRVGATVGGGGGGARRPRNSTPRTPRAPADAKGPSLEAAARGKLAFKDGAGGTAGGAVVPPVSDGRWRRAAGVASDR